MPCIIFCLSSAAGPLPHPPPARPIHPAAGAGGSVAGQSGDSKRWPARIFHPPPRTPPVTKWRNDAVPRMRSAADAPESYAPATFSRPVFPPRRHPGPRRRRPPVGRSGCGAQHRRGRSLHRGRAARRGGEGSRGARPGRDMALWEDRSGRHPGCAQRFPHDSAVATPMWRGAGRNDPPRAPESESDGVRRAPPDALGVGGGAPARPRGPTPTTTRPRTPPDTPDEPPTTPRTRLNRLHQRSGQHRRSSPPTAPPTTGARTRVCCAPPPFTVREKRA